MDTKDTVQTILARLQAHVPFLQEMIKSLKPEMPQYEKIVALHAMITDKKRKFKTETLKKCEEVIIKMQTKTYKKRVEQSVDTKKTEPSVTSRTSPLSPEKEVVPTIRSPDPESWNPMSLERLNLLAKSDRYISEKPSIYSSAAESIGGRKSVFDRLTLPEPDISKPPISVADLELLKDDLEYECNTTNKPEPPKIASRILKLPSKVSLIPAPILKPKGVKVDSKIDKKGESDSEKKEKAQADKVVKDANSIFGNLLSNIDKELIKHRRDSKDGPRPDEEKKKSDGKKESRKSTNKPAVGEKPEGRKNEGKSQVVEKLEGRKSDKKPRVIEKPEVPKSVSKSKVIEKPESQKSDNKPQILVKPDGQKNDNKQQVIKKAEGQKVVSKSKVIEKSESQKSDNKQQILVKAEGQKSDNKHRVIEKAEGQKVVSKSKVIEKSESQKSDNKPRIIEKPEGQKSDGKPRVIEKPEGQKSDGKPRVIEKPVALKIDSKPRVIDKHEGQKDDSKPWVIKKPEGHKSNVAVKKSETAIVKPHLQKINVSLSKSEPRESDIPAAKSDVVKPSPDTKGLQKNDPSLKPHAIPTILNSVIDKPKIFTPTIDKICSLPVLRPVARKVEEYPFLDFIDANKSYLRDTKGDDSKPVEKVYKRLADKYNPKPRRPSDQSELPKTNVVDQILKEMNKSEDTVIPFIMSPNNKAVDENPNSDPRVKPKSIELNKLSNDEHMELDMSSPIWEPPFTPSPPFSNQSPKFGFPQNINPTTFQEQRNFLPGNNQINPNAFPMNQQRPIAMMNNMNLNHNQFPMNQHQQRPMNPLMQHNQMRQPMQRPQQINHQVLGRMNIPFMPNQMNMNKPAKQFTPFEPINSEYDLSAHPPIDFYQPGPRVSNPYTASNQNQFQNSQQFRNNFESSKFQRYRPNFDTHSTYKSWREEKNFRDPRLCRKDDNSITSDDDYQQEKPWEQADAYENTSQDKSMEKADQSKSTTNECGNSVSKECPKSTMTTDENREANCDEDKNSSGIKSKDRHERTSRDKEIPLRKNRDKELAERRNSESRERSKSISRERSKSVNREDDGNKLTDCNSRRRKRRSPERDWRSSRKRERSSRRSKYDDMYSKSFIEKYDDESFSSPLESVYSSNEKNPIKVSLQKFKIPKKIKETDVQTEEVDTTSNSEKTIKKKTIENEPKVEVKKADSTVIKKANRKNIKKHKSEHADNADDHESITSESTDDLGTAKIDAEDASVAVTTTKDKIETVATTKHNVESITATVDKMKSVTGTKGSVKSTVSTKDKVESVTKTKDKVDIVTTTTNDIVECVAPKEVAKEEQSKVVDSTSVNTKEDTVEEKYQAIPETSEPKKVSTEESKPDKDQLLEMLVKFKESADVNNPIMGMFGVIVDYLKTAEKGEIKPKAESEMLKKEENPPTDSETKMDESITDDVTSEANDASDEGDTTEEQSPKKVTKKLVKRKQALKIVPHVRKKPGPKPKIKIPQDIPIETVSERIKSRKREVIPRKPRKNELDKLHDDIKETLGDGVLMSSKRSCTMQKEVNGEFAETILDKTKKLRVVLQKLPETKRLKRRMDTESDESPLPKRKSMTRATKLITTCLDEADVEASKGIEEQDVDVESEFSLTPPEMHDLMNSSKESKELKVVKKRRKSSAWATGIIKKKKKVNSKKDDESGEDVDDEETISKSNTSDEPGLIAMSASDDNQTKSTGEACYVEPDKEYYLRMDFKNTCKLCNFTGKQIIHHYTMKHPKIEYPVARMSPGDTEHAIEDAKADRLDSREVEEVETGKGLRRDWMSYKCRFCLTDFNSVRPITFYDHITAHTGEFRFKCYFCPFKNISKKSLRMHMNFSHEASAKSVPIFAEYEPATNKNIYGYVCSECNFVQLNKLSVEEHIQIYHLDDTAYLQKVNMSLKLKQPELPPPAIKEDSMIKEVNKELTEKIVAGKVADKGQREDAQVEEQMDNRESAVTPQEEIVKDPDMTAFMCDTVILEEEMNFKEKRLEKMKAIQDSIQRTKRTSFVNQLKDRLETATTDSHGVNEAISDKLPEVTEVEVSKETTLDLTAQLHNSSNATTSQDEGAPLQIVEDTTSSKVEAVTIPTTINSNTKPSKKIVDRTQLSLSIHLPDKAPRKMDTVGGIVNRLQNKLSTSLLPKLSKVVKTPTEIEDNVEKLISAGVMDALITKSKGPFYVCRKPSCIFRTPLKKVFEAHCTLTHKSEQSLLTCSICSNKWQLPMLEVFQHLCKHVDEEVNGQKTTDNKDDAEKSEQAEGGDSDGNDDVVEIIERPVEAIVITDDEESPDQPGPMFSFKITNVTSLAHVKDEEEVAPTEAPREVPPLIPISTPERPQQNTIIVGTKVVMVNQPQTTSPAGLKRGTRPAILAPPKQNVVNKSPNIVTKQIVLNQMQAVRNLSFDAGKLLFNHSPNSLLINPPRILTRVSSPNAVSPTQTSQAAGVSVVKCAVKCKVVSMSQNERHLQRKYAKILEKWLTPEYIGVFFKCPEFFCEFATESEDLFDKHMLSHSPSIFMPCLYCHFKMKAEFVKVHLMMRHARCPYGCPYCFYRAISADYIQIHQELEHISKPIKCLTFTNILQNSRYKSPPLPNIKLLMTPYRCKCSRKYYVRANYEKHLTLCMPTGKYVCSECSMTFSKTFALVAHLAKHQIFEYTCRYCPRSDKRTYDVLKHIATEHPYQVANIISRQLNDQSIHKPMTTVSSLENDDVFSNLFILTNPDETIGTSVTIGGCNPAAIALTSGTEPVLPTPTSAVEAILPAPVPLLEEVPCIPSSALEQIFSAPVPTVELVPPTPDTPILTPTRTSTPIPTLTSTPTPTLTPPWSSTPENNDYEESLDLYLITDYTNKKTGLSGPDLFRCVTCSNSFADSQLLKLHLIQCTFVGTNARPFTCFHCLKTFKTVGNLIDHIRIHGTMRIGCSLCPYRHAHPWHLRTHMKIKHKINACTIVPTDPNKRNIDFDEFLAKPAFQRRSSTLADQMSPSRNEMMTPNTSVSFKRVSFGPKDIDQLPPQAIYNYDVFCSICKYTTKVRMNLVRHMGMHEKNTEAVIPVTAPINPVPCLEKNELMFDKMTNLAISSHAGGRMGVKVVKDENVDLPAFIPITKRYVCGANNCNYLCLEESMLKRHLQALHGHEQTYTCVHCQQDLSMDKPILNVDKVLKHLRMHDTNLYACSACRFMHYNRNKVDKHCSERHPDSGLKAEPIREIIQPVADIENKEKRNRPWKCGMCKSHFSSKNEVKTHAEIKHCIDAQYKCSYCDFKGPQRDVFEAHFNDNHKGYPNDIIVVYYSDQENAKADAELTNNFDTTPLWVKNKNSIKHIRGILLEEHEKIIKKSPVKIGATPAVDKSKSAVKTVSNLDLAIEAVATGTDDVIKYPVKRGRKSDLEKKRLEKQYSELVTQHPRKYQKTDMGPVPRIEFVSVRDHDSLVDPVSGFMPEIESVLEPVPEQHQAPEPEPEPEPSPVVVKTEAPDTAEETDGDPMLEVLDAEVSESHRSRDPEIHELYSMPIENLLEGTFMGTYGPFGKPHKKRYMCPLCAVYNNDDVNLFENHLCEELQYSRFGCNKCSFRTTSLIRAHKHLTTHKLVDQAQATNLSPNRQIENWIGKVRVYQGLLIKHHDPNAKIDDDKSHLKGLKKIIPALQLPSDNEPSPSHSKQGTSDDTENPTESTKGNTLPGAESENDLAEVLRNLKMLEGCGFLSTNVNEDIDSLLEEKATGSDASKLKPKLGTTHYRCGYCTYSSKRRLIVVKHIQVSHPTRTVLLTKVLDVSNNMLRTSRVTRSNFWCSKCNYTTENLMELRFHMEKAYGRDTQAAYVERVMGTSEISKQTARKSTGGGAQVPATITLDSELVSYYGKAPDLTEEECKGTYTTLHIMNSTVTLNVTQLSKIVNIFPKVTVQDCVNGP